MPVQRLKPEEEFVLDAAFGRVEAARRAVDQARRELGAVMRSIGLSASARHLDRSRQWALQVAKESEEPRTGLEEGSPAGDDLADSIRRLGIVEPITVEVVDDEFLRVLDGHRRLRVARESGLTSLPVSLRLHPQQAAGGPEVESPAAQSASEARGEVTPNVRVVESAVRGHRRVRFFYRGLEGDSKHRTVDVWGLVWRSKLAYMVGFDLDRAAIRTFRLDRVLDGIEVIGEGNPAPEGFSAERNVWSQLDPEMIEAMAGFMHLFQEFNRQKENLDEAALERMVELGADRSPGSSTD